MTTPELEIDYRFNGDTRRLKARPGKCHHCLTPVLWVQVSWNVFHSVDPVKHTEHYSVCPWRVQEQLWFERHRNQPQPPRHTSAFEDSVACESMDCRDGWDD